MYRDSEVSLLLATRELINKYGGRAPKTKPRMRALFNGKPVPMARLEEIEPQVMDTRWHQSGMPWSSLESFRKEWLALKWDLIQVRIFFMGGEGTTWILVRRGFPVPSELLDGFCVEVLQR